jgi:type II secretory pathway pseudopilin PulG
LIAIAVIGILASFVIVNLNDTRAKARDAQRKSDLNRIGMAYVSYRSKTESFYVPNTGWAGSGEGWFNYENPGANYPVSMANGIKAAGYFSTTPPLDPGVANDSSCLGTQSSCAGAKQYMKYQCTDASGTLTGFAVYARLESPSASDRAAFADALSHGCDDTSAYGMNYAIFYTK